MVAVKSYYYKVLVYSYLIKYMYQENGALDHIVDHRYSEISSNILNIRLTKVHIFYLYSLSNTVQVTFLDSH